MNASSNCGMSKRPIFDAVNAAAGISNVCFAAVLERGFGRRGSVKERSFAPKQSGSLFCFGFFRRYFAEARLTNGLSGFICSDISTICRQKVSMSPRQMFLGSQRFEVFKSIVSFIAVNVVDVLGWIKALHPTNCYKAMHKQFSYKQIAHRVLGRSVKGVLSKNFSAARNGVKMVKGSIFDAIHCKANHAEPFRVIMSNQVLT